MRRCCCLIAALCCLLYGGTARGDDAGASDGNYSGSLVVDFDRDAAEALAGADEQLANGQTAAGLARLQQLLDRPSDVLVDRGESYVSLWEASNRRISILPEDSLEAYRRIVRVPSETALAAARNPLDPSALARLTDRYRHTPVGRESALLLASLAFDHGDMRTAAAWSGFLRRHYPTFSLPARTARWEQSRKTDVEEAPASAAAAGSWSLDLGVVESARHAVDGALAELNAQALTPILTCNPLLHERRLVTRTLTGLICVDAGSGELLWEHPISSHATRLATAPGTLRDPIRTSQISAILLRRLIRDSLEDELATDGESVFTLITPDRTAKGDSLWPANILRAVDIATGKLRWELKPPPPREGRRTRRRRAPAPEARYFLGPPLVHDAELWLPAQHGQNVELVSLDRHSGRVLWSVVIGQSVRDLWARERPGIGDPAPEDRERQSTACRLSRSGAHVLFPTGAGAIACVDVTRQRLVWVSRYPRRNLSAPAPTAGDETHFREMPTRDAFVAAESWIVGEVGICLAPDADQILAFDLASGQLLWSRPRNDTVQVILDSRGAVLLVGEAAVTALGVRDGESQWFTPIHRPVGRGIINISQLIVPISGNQFEFLRISDGTRIVGNDREMIRHEVTVTQHPPPSLRPVHLRNLHRSAEVIVSQSATSLERIVPTAPPEQERPVALERLKSLLRPVAEWRSDATPLVGTLRQIDSRIRLADGLLVQLLEQLGLKRSVDEQAETLLALLRRAEQDDDAESVQRLRQQLTSLDPRRLYVTSPDGEHTCRLDRWIGLPGDAHPQDREPKAAEEPEAADREAAAVPQPGWPWPATTPRVSEHQTSFGLSYLQRIPIDEQRPGIWSDVTVEADRQGQLLQLHDAARAEPAVFLLPRESGTFRLAPHFLQAWTRGNVLLVRIGTELVAFHRTQRGELPTSTLWPAGGQTLPLLGQRTPLPTSLRERPDETIPAWDTTSPGFEDVFGRGVGDVGPVREHYLCFQRRGEMIALETQTGEELWRRARWPVGTRCVGDDTAVVVFHPQQPQVTVLDAADGRTLRQWNLDDILAAHPVTQQTPFAPRQINGNRALLSRKVGGQLQLQALDMARGRVLWQRELPTAAIDFAVDDSRLGLAVPVIDDNVCSLLLLDWETGELSGEFEVAGPQDLQSVQTFADARKRYLILSGRITDLPLQNVPQIRGGLHRPLVNGSLHAFDVEMSDRLWSQPLNNMAFPIVQSRHVPLLIINDMSQPSGTHTPQGRLLCLDARTGERLAEVQQPTHVYYTLETSPAAGRIDVRLRGRTLRLDYRADPPAGQK